MPEQNYARKQVLRICRNRILWMLLLGGIAAVLLVTLAANPVNLYLTDAPVADLADLEGSYDHSLFWVKAEAEYMELWYTLSEDNRVVTRYYFWYTDDGGFVCVRSNTRTLTREEYEGFSFVGLLSKPSEDDAEAISRFTKELMSYYDLTSQEAADWISPYVINVSSPRGFSQVITGAGYLFVLFALWRILRAVSQLADYRRSKHYIKLGNDDDERERVNAQISAEMEKGQFIIDKKQTKITAQWFLQGMTVRRLSQLVWVYGNVTQHRTNGIPTGKTHAVALGFDDGALFSLPAKSEAEMKEFVNRLAHLPGDRIFGFDEKLKKLFTKDRQGFMELVRQAGAQRRAEEEARPAPEAHTSVPL